jgi:hypothetical protein
VCIKARLTKIEKLNLKDKHEYENSRKLAIRNTQKDIYSLSKNVHAFS